MVSGCSPSSALLSCGEAVGFFQVGFDSAQLGLAPDLHDMTNPVRGHSLDLEKEGILDFPVQQDGQPERVAHEDQVCKNAGRLPE